jgi:hypothetical protein
VLRENKNQIFHIFCEFTWSYGSNDTWLLLINDSYSLRSFDQFDTLGNSALGPLRDIELFGTWATSGLRALRHFGTSKNFSFQISRSSFPQRLGSASTCPLKINGSYPLRGLFLWRYTLCNFSLSKSRYPLIWTVLGISAAER